MLLVDIMHEFELGVWRAFFIHLLRILNSINKDLIHELDRRYIFLFFFFADDDGECLWAFVARSFRQVPTFGGDTIRRFSNNVSELKKLTARDFEDLLKASIAYLHFALQLIRVFI
jgi:hypothetical protein